MAKLRKEIPNNKRLLSAYELLGGYDVMSTNFTRTAAKDMIDKGIFEVPANFDKSRSDAQNRGYKISSIVRSLNDHLAYDSCSRISGEWILKYCRFFGCTPDFLYGFTDDPARIRQAVCDLTGLQMDSVIQQCTLKRHQYTMPVAGQMIDTLNAIFADPGCMSDFLITVGYLIGTVTYEDNTELELSDRFPELRVSDLNEPYQKMIRLERVGVAIENIKNLRQRAK